MSLRTIALGLLLTLGCGSCGGSQQGADPDVPEALADLTEYAEVVPFTDWSVPGLVLYRASWSMPDQSSSMIVGVDADGQRIGGVELMKRMGELSAEEMATRAFGVLMNEHGAAPLTAEDRAEIQFGTDAEWAVVEPARREEGLVIFYALQGEMAPELVEHRLDLETFEVETRTVAEVVVERGDTVPVGDPRCVAHASCGCWRGCVRVQTHRGPDGATHRILDGEGAGVSLVHRESCYEGTCFQVCIADTPEARCDPGVYEPVDEPCTGACAPSEAPYHCETLVDGCRQIDHPNRRPPQ